MHIYMPNKNVWIAAPEATRECSALLITTPQRPPAAERRRGHPHDKGNGHAASPHHPTGGFAVPRTLCASIRMRVPRGCSLCENSLSFYTLLFAFHFSVCTLFFHKTHTRKGKERGGRDGGRGAGRRVRQHGPMENPRSLNICV